MLKMRKIAGRIVLKIKKFFSPVISGRTVRAEKIIRKRKVILFSNPSSKRRFIFGIGSGLFLLGLAFLVFLYYPLARAFYNYRFGHLDAPPASSEEERTKAQEKHEINYNDFFITIPKIKAESKVIANVPATNKKVYMEALKKGVAHARGTGFPGQGKMIYLFAHSTDAPVNVVRYNAVFFLLNKLEKGDDIFVRFDGLLYRYRVTEKEILKANQTGALYFPDVKELLVLQTCWPPGTVWQRLLVLAEPFEEQD
jgi:sortase A